MTGAGIAHRVIECTLGDADGLGRHAGTRFVERLHGDDKTLAFLADQIFFGDPAILKNHLTGGGGANAHLVLFFAENQPFGAFFDDKGGGAAGAA